MFFFHPDWTGRDTPPSLTLVEWMKIQTKQVDFVFLTKRLLWLIHFYRFKMEVLQDDYTSWNWSTCLRCIETTLTAPLSVFDVWKSHSNPARRQWKLAEAFERDLYAARSKRNTIHEQRRNAIYAATLTLLGKSAARARYAINAVNVCLLLFLPSFVRRVGVCVQVVFPLIVPRLMEIMRLDSNRGRSQQPSTITKAFLIHKLNSSQAGTQRKGQRFCKRPNDNYDDDDDAALPSPVRKWFTRFPRKRFCLPSHKRLLDFSTRTWDIIRDGNAADV